MDILIIEDERSVRENLSDLLELNGYDVQVADNGRTGFYYAVEYQPDLVICDINMPELNGYDVLQNMKDHPETFAIPFIFLTGKSDSLDLRKGMELGADDYIIKPYANFEVLNSVKTRLEKYSRIKDKQRNELNDLRKNFNYSLPHELRTPLNSIIGFSQILVNTDSSEFDPDELGIIYKCIYDSGKRLHSLFENILLYNRLSVMDSATELRNLYDKLRVDQNLILLITEQVCKKYNRKNDLIINCDEVLIDLNYDYFSVILIELIDNAFKFSMQNTVVEIDCMADKLNLTVSIKNYGIGFSSKKISQIEAFRQFSRDTNEQQGIGLGLAIVKRIVDITGGKFEIDSLENEYARLIVYIPIEIK